MGEFWCYSQRLQQKTMLRTGESGREVLWAFVESHRGKLKEEGIRIYPAESVESLPVMVLAASEVCHVPDEVEESPMCRWGCYFDNYMAAAIRNPLAFANQHEGVAVAFLTAMATDRERILAEWKRKATSNTGRSRRPVLNIMASTSPVVDEAQMITDLNAEITSFRDRIAVIEANEDYVPMVLPEDFWNVDETQATSGKKVTGSIKPKKKTAARKQKLLTLDEVAEKVKHHIPIRSDDPLMFAATNPLVVKYSGLAEGTLRNKRMNREVMQVGDCTLSMDEDGRVFFRDIASGKIFYYSDTLNIKGRNFKDFHSPNK